MKIVDQTTDLRRVTRSKLGMKPQRRITLMPETPFKDQKENMALLEECRLYWESLRDFRNRRLRSRKYYRGDQWSDKVKDPDSDMYITEETYLKLQGKVPLKQNRIRQLGKNLIGQFLSNPAQTVVLTRSRANAELSEMLTNALQYASQTNMLNIVDPRAFEEFLISGAPIQKIGYEYVKERNLEDVVVSNINPNRAFFNTDVSDVRLTDLRLVGEIIDTTVDKIVSVFAKNPKDEQRIRDMYASSVQKDFIGGQGLDASKIDNLDFYISHEPDKARLFEIWKLKGEWRVYAHDWMDGSYDIVPYTIEDIAKMNRERINIGLSQGLPEDEILLIEADRKFEEFWYVKYLTPYGECLFEKESPYSHQEHPYALTLYPLLDGEVWGFVEDIIDQQRYINRLIIMLDFIMSSSAKGVLLIPEDCIPEGMKPGDFAKEWVRFNGVITYTPSTKHQKVPEQISANSTNIGIQEMLSLQMSLMQEISGVHSAIQGQQASAGTPAALYSQEAQNATLNTLDYMQTFQHFQQKRNTKMLKVITQFYKEPRYLAINGRTIAEASKLYDPKMAQNIDFDIVVTQGQDTPVYRQIIDETLMKLLDKQLIDLEMFLEQTSLPFADKLLAAVKQRKEQMAQGIPGQIPEEIMAQVNQGVDPAKIKLANKALGVQDVKQAA